MLEAAKMLKELGLAGVVILLLIFQVVPCLKEVKREIGALVILLCRLNGFSLEDLEDARKQAKKRHRK